MAARKSFQWEEETRAAHQLATGGSARDQIHITHFSNDKRNPSYSQADYHYRPEYVYKHPVYNQPQVYDQPAYKDPEYKSPEYNQPEYKQAQYKQPEYKQPEHRLTPDNKYGDYIQVAPRASYEVPVQGRDTATPVGQVSMVVTRSSPATYSPYSRTPITGLVEGTYMPQDDKPKGFVRGGLLGLLHTWKHFMSAVCVLVTFSTILIVCGALFIYNDESRQKGGDSVFSDLGEYMGFPLVIWGMIFLLATIRAWRQYILYTYY
eukprot:m.71351 g.71351  ORF g.71351 m.71351 type:complete len:263 (-) comp12239_c0_seq1:1970-2758(-)